MNLHEAIIQRLRDIDRIFIKEGMWTGDDYKELVTPLHQALLKLAEQSKPEIPHTEVQNESYNL